MNTWSRRQELAFNNVFHMKRFIYFLTFFCFLVLFSCTKEKKDGNATIIRNCTGTYLRIDNNDYLVCNSNKLSAYPDGTTLSVSFKTISNCNNHEFICMMHYPFEGTINVTKIN